MLDSPNNFYIAFGNWRTALLLSELTTNPSPDASVRSCGPFSKSGSRFSSNRYHPSGSSPPVASDEKYQYCARRVTLLLYVQNVKSPGSPTVCLISLNCTALGRTLPIILRAPAVTVNSRLMESTSPAEVYSALLLSELITHPCPYGRSASFTPPSKSGSRFSSRIYHPSVVVVKAECEIAGVANSLLYVRNLYCSRVLTDLEEGCCRAHSTVASGDSLVLIADDVRNCGFAQKTRGGSCRQCAEKGQ